MTIQLSKDLENFIQDAIRAGRYSTEDEVVRDALKRLMQSAPEENGAPSKEARNVNPARRAEEPLSEAQVLQQMLTAGLITALPDIDADFDDPDDQPIAIQGEPLSETIIRERR